MKITWYPDKLLEIVTTARMSVSPVFFGVMASFGLTTARPVTPEVAGSSPVILASFPSAIIRDHGEVACPDFFDNPGLRLLSRGKWHKKCLSGLV